MFQHLLLRSHRTVLVISALALVSAQAGALTITLAAGVSATDATPSIQCPIGDGNDYCHVKATLALVPRNSSSPVFDAAWQNWSGLNAGWTLAAGGALTGSVNVTTFKAYNGCPGNGGVEIQASFIPGAGDPASWKWAQGLLAPRTNSPHAGPAAARSSYMDVNAAGPNLPPLYPFSYPAGFFYDKPGRTCVHNSIVSWSATCLLANANYTTKTLTTYEGFSYGFDFTCVHVPVPEPASFAALGLGIVGLIARRRRKRA